jgi:hypothetical protein
MDLFLPIEEPDCSSRRELSLDLSASLGADLCIAPQIFYWKTN